MMKYGMLISFIFLVSIFSVYGHHPDDEFELESKPSTYFPDDFDDSQQYPEKYIEIRAKRYDFNPSTIRVNKGDVVTIKLIPTDVSHGIYIDGYEIETNAHPGQTGTLKFYADKQGRFTYRCAVTCGDFHPYMVGYLIVEPNMRLNTYIGLTLVFGLVSILIILFKRGEEDLPSKQVPEIKQDINQLIVKKETGISNAGKKPFINDKAKVFNQNNKIILKKIPLPGQNKKPIVKTKVSSKHNSVLNPKKKLISKQNTIQNLEKLPFPIQNSNIKKLSFPKNLTQNKKLDNSNKNKKLINKK